MALVRKPEVERYFRQRQPTGCQLPLSFADALVKHVLMWRKSDNLLEQHGEIVGAQPGQTRQLCHLDVRVEMCVDVTACTPNALDASL